MGVAWRSVTMCDIELDDGSCVVVDKLPRIDEEGEVGLAAQIIGRVHPRVGTLRRARRQVR